MRLKNGSNKTLNLYLPTYFKFVLSSSNNLFMKRENLKIQLLLSSIKMKNEFYWKMWFYSKIQFNSLFAVQVV